MKACYWLSLSLMLLASCGPVTQFTDAEVVKEVTNIQRIKQCVATGRVGNMANTARYLASREQSLSARATTDRIQEARKIAVGATDADCRAYDLFAMQYVQREEETRRRSAESSAYLAQSSAAMAATAARLRPQSTICTGLGAGMVGCNSY